METIYQIKIRSNKNSLASYPSERRYSASIVLGLSAIYLILALFAFLCAILTFIEISRSNILIDTGNNTKECTTETIQGSDCILIRMREKVRNENYVKKLPFVFNIIVAGSLLFFGSLAASIGGFMASKKWYIDTNIKWFFMTACGSVLFKFVSILLLIWTIIIFQPVKKNVAFLNFYHIAAQILIASIFGLVWSLISLNISYKGMNNSYNEENYLSNDLPKADSDIIKPKMTAPPDLINHFPTGRKLIEYWSKIKDNSPSKESIAENDRANSYLQINPTDANNT